MRIQTHTNELHIPTLYLYTLLYRNRTRLLVVVNSGFLQERKLCNSICNLVPFNCCPFSVILILMNDQWFIKIIQYLLAIKFRNQWLFGSFEFPSKFSILIDNFQWFKCHFWPIKWIRVHLVEFLRIGPQLSQLVTDSNQSTNNFIYWKDLDKLRVAADDNPNQLP